MGYTDHPTASNKPIEELNEKESMDEIVVRVMCEAHNMMFDPMSPPQSKSLGSLMLSMIQYFTGEDYDRLHDNMADYARWQAQRMAEESGKTLEEFLTEAGASEDEIKLFTDHFDTTFNA